MRHVRLIDAASKPELWAAREQRLAGLGLSANAQRALLDDMPDAVRLRWALVGLVHAACGGALLIVRPGDSGWAVIILIAAAVQLCFGVYLGLSGLRDALRGRQQREIRRQAAVAIEGDSGWLWHFEPLLAEHCQAQSVTPETAKTLNPTCSDSQDGRRPTGGQELANYYYWMRVVENDHVNGERRT